MPCINDNRVIYADIFFASVVSAELLLANGLKLIGVAKIATNKCHMTYLGAIELENRGDMFGLIRSKESEDECNMLAFAWMD